MALPPRSALQRRRYQPHMLLILLTNLLVVLNSTGHLSRQIEYRDAHGSVPEISHRQSQLSYFHHVSLHQIDLRRQPGSGFTRRLWVPNLLVWFRSLVRSLVEIVSAVWHLGYINAPRGPTALSSSLHLVSQTQYLKSNTSNPIPQTTPLVGPTYLAIEVAWVRDCLLTDLPA
jgi:hypothetical protein